MGSNPSHSTAKAFRLAFICIVSGAAMAVSAVAGAWVQSQLSAGSQAGEPHHSTVADGRQHAEYIRENVSMLAAKLGDMQARLIRVEGVARRVAEAAGVSFTAPEIHTGLQESLLDLEADRQLTEMHSWTAESLGRELDALESELTAGTEQLRMLDAVLTQRNAVRESLPSINPVNHPYLSSSYGWRRHPITGRHTMHEGLDFAAPRGSPIVAASAGVVTEARYVPGYGKMVEINHGNGLVTRYAHASSISVKLGQLVSKGETIARVGSTGRSTGAHLHYEVRIAGHALDPTLFMEEAQADTQNAPAAIAAAGG